MNSRESRVCLAFDGMSTADILKLAMTLGPRCRALKLHDAVDREGPTLIKQLSNEGAPWADLKLHDTYGTVGLRAEALSQNGAEVITVHASGGVRMMRAAVEATRAADGSAITEIWAVTILTSLDDEEIRRIYGRDRTREKIVTELALMAQEAGVDGIVCSALEVGILSREPRLQNMQFIVPGTRSVGVDLGQQSRSATPTEAIRDGATYLVAGSQVTKNEDPEAAFDAFEAEIERALQKQ